MTRDLPWPVLFDGEWKYLRGRGHEEVIAFEEAAYGTVPVAA